MARKFLDISGLTYLINKIIGKTSIKNIGDGTLTGAVSKINSRIGKDVPSNAVFTDTWIALKGATNSAAGNAGYAPAPSAGASNRYLRSDGTWSVPPDNNTTYSNMTAATSNAAGKSGLVPAPAAGKQASFLRGDGTWVVPPNTTYGIVTTSANGLMSSTDYKALSCTISDIDSLF